MGEKLSSKSKKSETIMIVTFWNDTQQSFNNNFELCRQLSSAEIAAQLRW